MKNKTAIILFLLAGFGLFLRFQIFAKGEVHPRLLALKQPYRSVETFHFQDGGSVGIEIVGNDGKTEQFAIPSHNGGWGRYNKVFVGALHDSKSGALEIKNPQSTKMMLIRIVENRPNRSKGDDFWLEELNMNFADHAYAIIKDLISHAP